MLLDLYKPINSLLDFPFSSDTEVFPVEVKETGEGYTLTAHIPGVKKDEITVDYQDQKLILGAERKVDNEDKEENLLRREISYGRFERRFLFPDVDSEKIEAEYKNGVLEVLLPKEDAKKAQKIKVQ